jgi:polar amino acid transport system substrate-binding protein
LAAGVVAVVMLAGCDYPRDTGTTLEDVRSDGIIRAGISANPPWTTVDGGRPGGSEAEMVERFAKRLDARVEWRPGSESTLMAEAHERKLDLVVAGLQEDAPWTEEAALTAPYEDKRVWAVPPGENAWQIQVEDFLLDEKRGRERAGR